ncbi:TonB-dependent receptor [Dyadobacter sp. CY323]|uniref:TonB-dependent receptor n=1 Tax=Dyadobacter sp. CY323 TaxID=2907302 RepID=UPI001F177FAC|nr:TonB-dependent receptor [Dyadobacter sp. CY323]MCE6991094.1 TonB-dependent receptor [Dyadobacter sp. CY323]
MKKSIPLLFKVSLVQVFIALTFASLSWATHVSAQEVLERRLSIQMQGEKVKNVLSRIESLTKVKFSYSPQIVQSNRKVSIELRNATLAQVLDKLSLTLGLTYDVSGNQIILKNLPAVRSDIQPADNEPLTKPMQTKQADRQIKGKVTDEKGEVLPGANVLLKGTTTGTTTDSEGNFSLNVGDAGTLVISSIGYNEQQVVLDARSTYDIRLKADIKALNEVVVIGYGAQSRKTLATAVAKVEGKMIGSQPVGTPGEALAALASGVQVQSDRGGTPGAAPTIRIRGVGSLGTNSTPLYVVDGYPLQDASQFNLINPRDIESMEILKDAASAAIYGSRAANGVVIVTTRRGKAGKTSFNFSAYTGIQQISKKVDVLNRDEYIEHAGYIGRLRNLSVPLSFTANPDSLPDTDWQDEIYRLAPMSNYEISATGGSEKVRFAISGAYFKQDGVLKGTSYQRYNVRFNLDADLSSKLRIGVSIAPSYSRQFQQQAAGQFSGSNSSETNGTRTVPSAVISAINMPPTIPAYLPNGDYAQGFNGNTTPSGTPFYQPNLFNPLAVIELNKNRYKNYRLFGNSYLEFEPITNLKLKTSVGSTMNITDQYSYIPATMASEQAPTANASNPVLGQIYSREAQNVGIDWLWENTASYNKGVGGHNFSLLALYSVQKFQSKATAVLGRAGSFTTDVLQNPLASPDLVGQLDYDQNAFLSYGGRLMYDYKSKYLFSAALRRDASSRFGPNNRFATFPSFSAGWRISEEKFMESLANVLNELKIRASYGETGNANIGSFTWANRMAGSNYSFGQTRAFGYEQNGFVNYDLTWEKNSQADIGLEAGFLGDKFSISIDYYDRKAKGMLFQKDLPGIVGSATSFRTNLGSLQNRGLELSAKANLRLGAVLWSIDGNISGNRSKVLDLGGPAFLTPQASIGGWNNVYQVRVGDPLGNMYGFEVEGIFKTAEDLKNHAQYTTGDKVGNWMIKDQNGDNKIDESDRTLVGKGVPSFIYGMSHSVQYKNFDLSVIIQGVQGASLINGNLRHNFGTVNFNTVPMYFRNMFDPANPDRDVEFPMAGAGGIAPNNNLTNRQVFDASFLRVRNVTIGFNLPATILKTIGLQSLRIYASGQNLFTFTKYTWYNPETNVNVDAPVQIGIDQGTYPATRTYTLGLNIGF